MSYPAPSAASPAPAAGNALTADDVWQFLQSEYHNGWGWATNRVSLPPSFLLVIDGILAEVANELRLDEFAFGEWLDSKFARWAMDEIAGDAGIGASYEQLKAIISRHLGADELLALASES